MNLRTTVVLGMHRAGTSAVTGCLHELGLALPRRDDLIVAADNPQHFESRLVVDHSELLLADRGGSWDVPAPPNSESETSIASQQWTAEATRVLETSFPTSPFVIKDPRLCLTLDAWRPVLDVDIRTILVVRRPDDVAASLQRRNGMTETHALALWESYMWSAERHVQSQRCFVLSFEQLRADPEATIGELADFVGSSSVDARARALSTLDHSIGRSDGRAPHPLVAHRAAALYSLHGPHERFVTDVPELAPWATEHLNIIGSARKAELEARHARRRSVKIALAKLPGLQQVHAARASREVSGKSS